NGFGGSGFDGFGSSGFTLVGFFGFGSINFDSAMQSGTGRPGFWRLFIPPLSKEASWLLPLALLGMLLLLFRSRWQWPLAPKHQALALWGGWLLTGSIFLSIAEFYHEYYLSIIAAPLAALAGIAIGELWSMLKRHP